MKACFTKVLSLGWLILLFIVLANHQNFAQHHHNVPGGSTSGGGQQCDGNGYSTEVIKAVMNENGCIEYELKISHDATVRYGLSHFSLALPCGIVTNLSNSENWKQVIGKDPTTGLTGFKIDDISNFGKSSQTSFTIKVTICGDSTCDKKLGVVAYKAGTCVDYDTLNYTVTYPHDGGGNTGGGGGDSTGGGDGGSSGDSTKTCSTLLASLVKQNATCFGNADGKITVSIQSGKAPFTYQWSTGVRDSALYNTTAGKYSVTLQDADGNTLTLAEEITQMDDIVITSVVVNSSCLGSSSGSIDISVAGGSGSFSYFWNNNATTQDLTNLASGFYSIMVKDNTSGCSKTSFFLLSNTSLVSLSSIIKNPDCGQANGNINLTVNGGTAPFTFLWNNGAITEDINNIMAGSYTVTVTDASGCKTTGTYSVKDNSSIRVSFKVTPASCANDPIGAIDLTVTAGTAPFTYSWQHGPTTEDISGLASGTYRVTVTDATGCSLLTVINIPKKTIQVTSKIVQPVCFGDTTGSITLTPTVIGSYTYSWSNGGTSNTLSGLEAGTYTVTITDEFGCSVTLAYTLTQPTSIQTSPVTSNNQCGTEGNFSIDLSVTGGSLPYTYAWSTGATTQDLTNINSGTYSVNVTDVNHCSAVKEIIIDAMASNWTCSILAPTAAPTCGSAGNTISSAAVDGSTYSWNVVSSDNSWIITAGSASSKTVYTAGTAGVSATFTLTMQKDGCTKICTYTITSGCTVRDNNGGGDPTKGDPCSGATTTPLVVDNTPPAAASTDVTDGNTPPSISTDNSHTEDLQGGTYTSYPNPFDHHLDIEFKPDYDHHAKIDMIDCQGQVVKDFFKGDVRKGETYRFNFESSEIPKGIYFCRYASPTRTKYMKVLKK